MDTDKEEPFKVSGNSVEILLGASSNDKFRCFRRLQAKAAGDGEVYSTTQYDKYKYF